MLLHFIKRVFLDMAVFARYICLFLNTKRHSKIWEDHIAVELVKNNSAGVSGC